MTLSERMDALHRSGLKHVNYLAARFIEQMGREPIRVTLRKPQSWAAYEYTYDGCVWFSIGCEDHKPEDWPRFFLRHARKWKATKTNMRIALAALNMSRAHLGLKPYVPKGAGL